MLTVKWLNFRLVLVTIFWSTFIKFNPAGKKKKKTATMFHSRMVSVWALASLITVSPPRKKFFFYISLTGNELSHDSVSLKEMSRHTFNTGNVSAIQHQIDIRQCSIYFWRSFLVLKSWPTKKKYSSTISLAIVKAFQFAISNWLLSQEFSIFPLYAWKTPKLNTSAQLSHL